MVAEAFRLYLVTGRAIDQKARDPLVILPRPR
jgi:hypothetical protein